MFPATIHVVDAAHVVVGTVTAVFDAHVHADVHAACFLAPEATHSIAVERWAGISIKAQGYAVGDRIVGFVGVKSGVRGIHELGADIVLRSITQHHGLPVTRTSRHSEPLAAGAYTRGKVGDIALYGSPVDELPDQITPSPVDLLPTGTGLPGGFGDGVPGSDE